jgi:uncharacterized membrane protein
MDAMRHRAPRFLATIFAASGIVHLLRPRTFETLIPSWLPRPRTVIHLSGVVELICATGLVARKPWARSASVLLLIAVFPGNIKMATDAARESNSRMSARQVLAFARLPLQLPLIWAALQSPTTDRR